MGDTFISNNR